MSHFIEVLKYGQSINITFCLYVSKPILEHVQRIKNEVQLLSFVFEPHCHSKTGNKITSGSEIAISNLDFNLKFKI